MRALAWALVCVVLAMIAGVVAYGAGTDAKDPKYPLRFYLSGRWVNGDSSDVVAAYPSNEDTTGKRNALTWVGGTFQQWTFEPDSTEYYDFFCNDTLMTTFSGRLFWANNVPERFVESARAFAAGVVDSSALATDAAIKSLKASSSSNALTLTTPDSTIKRIEADTLQGRWLRATGVIEAVDTFTASDGTLSGLDSLRTRTIRTTGNTRLGDGLGDVTYIVGGIVQGSGASTFASDATFNSDVDIDTDLNVNRIATFQDSIVVGASGDTTTTHPVTGFWRMTSGQVLTVPSGTGSGTLAYPGAVEGMYFISTSADGVGTSLLLRNMSFVYSSPGHVSYLGTTDLSNDRDFFVIGFKR